MEKNSHKILALKYRPQNFQELIGQDIMVETIINSIKSNRIANAFLLTGVRGTGKTSTARIISKSLTCNGNFFENVKCKSEDTCHCEEITNYKHLDIIECDAASRTGVEDVREIIESSKYKPTNARYKIYIIDECHMLSKSAWNALLKTLEEPPEQLKFIFCTTEPKKVPLTIISRCQTFNLHRVSIKDLFDHLKKIAKIEKGKISDAALRLIAKAGSGSVRDSLSLLDRALVSQYIDEKEVDENKIRKMLGIVDRSKILELLKYIFEGNQKKSIETVRQMIEEGLDIANLKNDILELIYFMLQKKNIGEIESDLAISESELNIINVISKEISTSTLILFWQFTLKALEEDKLLSNSTLGLEMLVIRLLHLKGMPSYEDIVKERPEEEKKEFFTSKKVNEKLLEEENEQSKISKDQIKNTTQTKPQLSGLYDKDSTNNNKRILSLEDLIRLASKKKEIHLKYDLEKNVNLIKFSEGKIDISFNESLDKNFVRNLSEKLLEWTGKRWVITLAKEKGQKTFSETESIRRKELFDKEKKGEIYKKFKDIFSDVELLEVEKKD